MKKMIEMKIFYFIKTFPFICRQNRKAIIFLFLVNTRLYQT